MKATATKTSAEIERTLAKVRDKRAALQENERAWTKKYNELEKEYGHLSARDQDVTKVDADLDTASKARRKIKLTIEALDRDIHDLERQVADAHAAERAQATNVVVARADAQFAELKRATAVLIEKAEALRDTWAELGAVSGTMTRPTHALAVGLAVALYPTLDEFRQLCVRQHDATLDQWHQTFTHRAARATAVGGRSGEAVRDAQAAVAERRA